MSDTLQQLERSEGYLAADPGNPELLARVIDLSLAAGELERAERHAQTALQRFPGDAYFEARRGTVHIARHQWPQAATLFEALLKRHADINLAYNLAYAYQWQGRHADAYQVMAAYSEAPELTPAMVTLLVRTLHHLGEGERAIALAHAQMARCQGDPVFLAAASLAMLDSGDLAEAERLSATALALGAQQGQGRLPLEALVVGGSVALGRAEGAAATAYFQQVLEQNPREGRSWSGLGTASLLLRDLPAAQQQLEQAVALMPSHIGTWHLLGWSRILGRELDGARSAFDTALGLDRNFGESHGGMAVVLALQGQREQAEAAIERALGLDRDSLSARYAQMILSGQTEDPERFRALAGRLLASRQGAFGVNLGQLLKQYEEQ